MLEAGTAFNAVSIFVFGELSSDVCGCVKDWREFIVTRMSNRAGGHAHRVEAELDATGSECAALMIGRIEALRHTEDLGRMRKEAGERINSGKSGFDCSSGGSAFGHGNLSWIGPSIQQIGSITYRAPLPDLGSQIEESEEDFEWPSRG
jgi:hypothetical protein